MRRTRSAENVNLPPQIIINQVNTVIITIIIVIKITIMIINNIIICGVILFSNQESQNPGASLMIPPASREISPGVTLGTELKEGLLHLKDWCLYQLLLSEQS